MSRNPLNRLVTALVFMTAAAAPATLLADAPPAPQTKHQMMKDCMRKQKASEAGRTQEDMKQACRDVTKTEKENAEPASHMNSPHN
jgi:hypothetical protein